MGTFTCHNLRKALRLKILETVFNSGTGHLEVLFLLLISSIHFIHHHLVILSLLSKGHTSLALYSFRHYRFVFNLEDRYGSLSTLGDLHGRI